MSKTAYLLLNLFLILVVTFLYLTGRFEASSYVVFWVSLLTGYIISQI